MIERNSRGTPVIAKKNFKIRQLAADYRTISQDSVEIQRHHPHLTLEEGSLFSLELKAQAQSGSRLKPT